MVAQVVGLPHLPDDAGEARQQVLCVEQVVRRDAAGEEGRREQVLALDVGHERERRQGSALVEAVDADLLRLEAEAEIVSA
ncbi:MAG: hypothetical protein R2748_12555 [Bryobacterales bacterium]